MEAWREIECFTKRTFIGLSCQAMPPLWG